MTALPVEFYPGGPKTAAERALEAAMTDQTSPGWVLAALASGARSDPAAAAEFFRGAATLFENLAIERYGAVADALAEARTHH